MLIRGFLTLLCCLLASPVYAFPSTGVLETFTGVDGTSPPNSNWTNVILQGAGSVNIDLEDNAATTSADFTAGDAIWNPTTFGASCEAYATVVEVTNFTGASMGCRYVNIGSNTTDGYRVLITIAASTVSIQRVDNGAATTLGANMTQTITPTDKWGIKAVGDQICAWFSDSGGAWTELGCRTDATYSAGGHIGMTITSNSSAVGAIDDFGGGTVGSTRRPIAPIFFP